MSRTNHQKPSEGDLYERRNGDIVVRFVKPLRLTKKVSYKEHSIAFEIPL